MLPGDIISGERQVYLIIGYLEHTSEMGKIKICNPCEERMNQVGIFYEIDEDLFETSHIPACFEDISVRNHRRENQVTSRRDPDAAQPQRLTKPRSGG